MLEGQATQNSEDNHVLFLPCDQAAAGRGPGWIPDVSTPTDVTALHQPNRGWKRQETLVPPSLRDPRLWNRWGQPNAFPSRTWQVIPTFLADRQTPA